MTHTLRCLPVLLLAFLLSACGGLSSNPSPPNAQPPAGPDSFGQGVAPPQDTDFGELPDPQHVTPKAIDVPGSFPVLNEQSEITQYVKTMADIHMQAMKARQVHEVPPKYITAVKGAVTCPTVRGETGTLRQVGDTAKDTKAGKAMLIASCYRGNQRSIFFAPYKLYTFSSRQATPEALQELIRKAMRDYAAGLTQDKAGTYDKLIVACTSGRMVGGLAANSYISSQFAYNLEVESTNQSEYAKVFRTARDTGNCPPRLFGRTS